jgi:pectin methylesterase-like acyl-CoA thioesterase
MGSVHAARITVGPEDEDYQQIQQAINNASMGDVIEVHSGIYQERLHVTKALTLMGIDTGKGLPVINASAN